MSEDFPQAVGMITKQQSNRIKELEHEIIISDQLLKEHLNLLKAIPACPAHGAQCIPHAIEWVNRVKTLGRIIVGDKHE